MQKTKEMVAFFTQRIRLYFAPLIKDWEEILWLAREIGEYTIWFIGFLLMKVARKIPYLQKLVNEFDKGMQHGLQTSIEI